MDNFQGLEEYFARCRTWYNQKYIKPLSDRSYALCACIISVLLVMVVFLAIYKMLPVNTVLRYAVWFDGSKTSKQITINPANAVAADPLLSIAKALVENYVIQTEQYNFDKLKNQLIFVDRNSSKYVFKQYYSFININNQLSPVIRFQDQAIRSIEILSTTFESSSRASVRFGSVAKDINNKIIEKMLWQADIMFEIDPIVIGLANGSKFNFLVTSYKIKLLNNEEINQL